jgi:hypothetical protein
MKQLNYGDKVTIVKGRYAGCVGVYEDDIDNKRVLIIPDTEHSFTLLKTFQALKKDFGIIVAENNLIRRDI